MRMAHGAVMSGKIFVNYRRDDSAPHALSVAQYLERRFGASNVFIDIDRLRAGENFPEVLEERLADCDVVLVVIGPNWLKAPGEDGSSRLEDPKDWVRLEIERTMARKITLIPVLVAGGELPKRDELPESIRALVDFNAVTVTTNGFRHEMAGLANDIEALRGPQRRRLAIAAAAGAVALGLIGLVYFLWVPRESSVKLAGEAVAASPASSCAQVKQAVAAATQDFIPVKGAATGEDTWQTSAALPNFGSCYLKQMRNLTLMCDGKEKPGKAEVVADIKAETQGYQTCLGNEWRTEELPDGAVSVSNYRSGHSIILSSMFTASDAYFMSAMLWRRAPSADESVVDATVKSPAKPDGYCETLKTVVAGAQKDFVKNLGEKEFGFWPAPHVLAGWNECTIGELTEGDPQTRWYTCELSPYATKFAASEVFEGVLADVKACLGKDWTPKPKSYDGLQYFHFVRSSKLPNIDVRMRKNYKGLWKVVLDVNLPKSAPP